VRRLLALSQPPHPEAVAFRHAFLTYHENAVAPCWTTIAADIEMERTYLAEAFLRGGAEAVLNALCPSAAGR